MRMNETEKTIQMQLKKDVPIPDHVMDHLQEAYRKIENKEVVREHIRTKRNGIAAACKIAGGLAAVLAIFFIYCISHPVVAKDLPWIGHLFERLQNRVSFYGDFSDVAKPLESEDSQTFSRTQDGMTVTVSEVYANSSAIYLTLLMEREEPFPELAAMDWSGADQGRLPEGVSDVIPLIYMEFQKDYSFMEYPEKTEMDKATLEGMFLDDHTYSCILRIDFAYDTMDKEVYDQKREELKQKIMEEMGLTQEDLTEWSKEVDELYTELSRRSEDLDQYIKQKEIPGEFKFHLDISRIAGIVYDEASNANEEVLLGEGSWNFEIPVSIDESQTVTLEINERDEKTGAGLRSVVKTPYELTVNMLRGQGVNSYCEMRVLDADGNAMPHNYSSRFTNNFTIQDSDLSAVKIYILDAESYMEKLQNAAWYQENGCMEEGEEWVRLLEKEALYQKTISFK